MALLQENLGDTAETRAEQPLCNQTNSGTIPGEFGTQPCTVLGYTDFCGSTVLGTPESVEMNGQIDWQAQQTSHLVCSLAGLRCSEA